MPHGCGMMFDWAIAFRPTSIFQIKDLNFLQLDRCFSRLIKSFSFEEDVNLNMRLPLGATTIVLLGSHKYRYAIRGAVFFI
jgi:hypothetical protein